MKELEQRAAIEEANTRASQCIASILGTVPSESFQEWATIVGEDPTEITTTSTKEDAHTEEKSLASELNVPVGLPEVEVLAYNNTEWSHDPFLNQMRSPWVDQWSPYANVLNFWTIHNKEIILRQPDYTFEK